VTVYFRSSRHKHNHRRSIFSDLSFPDSGKLCQSTSCRCRRRCLLV